jgi:hypothetical protein
MPQQITVGIGWIMAMMFVIGEIDSASMANPTTDQRLRSQGSGDSVFAAFRSGALKALPESALPSYCSWRQRMSTIQRNKSCLAITLGDAGGIGPEVTLKALAAEWGVDDTHYVVVGNGELLAELNRGYG